MRHQRYGTTHRADIFVLFRLISGLNV